jgi:hypothetical protein
VFEQFEMAGVRQSEVRRGVPETVAR